MEEVTHKVRSSKITGFHKTSTEVEGQPNMVTGQIHIMTENNEEILVFQAMVPISKTDFQTRFAALETALNEKWFQIPEDVEYRP